MEETDNHSQGMLATEYANATGTAFPTQPNGAPRRAPVILQVLPSLRAGGVERGTVEIAGAIADSGWGSIVASAGGPMVDQVLFTGSEHVSLPLDSKNPFTIWRNIARLRKVIRHYGVTIIHARSRAPAWSAWYAAKAEGIAFVTSFHGVYSRGSPLKEKYNRIMTRGDRVIAVSHFVADHIRKYYPIPEQKLRIIHRGVDMRRFHPDLVSGERMRELVRQWELPADRKLILMPGRITRWKGQHILIQALAQLGRRDFICLLVGDASGHGTYQQELQDLILQQGLEGYVRIAPNTQHIAEAYTLAHVVASPSLEPEAFGRIPIEAQAMARPVIATAHGGACETVLPGETGWLVPPGDVEALQRVLDDALELSEEQRQRMGQAGMDNVWAHFSLRQMASKTLAVYQELLQESYQQERTA